MASSGSILEAESTCALIQDIQPLKSQAQW